MTTVIQIYNNKLIYPPILGTNGIISSRVIG